MCKNSAQVVFYPVGQGLFSSGCVHVDHDNSFHWVYDCGTLSGAAILNSQIGVYSERMNKTGKIDLLAISHFDADHISGIVNLLEKYSVGTILLPYLPLYARLIQAFAQQLTLDSPLFDFYVNPVAYLARRGEIQRVVFVQSAPKGNAAKGDNEADIITGIDSDDKGLRIKTLRSLSDSESDEFEMLEQDSSVRMMLTPYGEALVYRECWEFAPYNDASFFPKISQNFIGKVSNYRHQLRHSIDPGARNIALENIKLAYDNQFGRSGLKRNAISLFLYAGPTDVDEGKCVCSGCISCHIYNNRQWNVILEDSSCGCCSILYTGDGDLSSGRKIDEMKNHFGNDRLNCVKLFQVMHHGSVKSSHKGVARKIAPCISIFNADPEDGRFSHPDSEVVKDFLPFGPILVDKHNGFILRQRFGNEW